ncbi:MAG: hypothetical protein MJ133_00815 [Lachnospiraceae bacterium]|nr:hypothetical protein [Lachnospiraceae bacterium]
MHRFSTKETKHGDKKNRFGVRYLILPVILIVFLIITNSLGKNTIDRQKDSLWQALNRDIMHCYAIEGYYPPSLAYIEEHYGLTYDHETFFVDYHPIGTNIRPDVTIIVKE